MELFTINDDLSLEIEPIVLLVPEFRKVWEADKTKDKKAAQKKFLYMYHMCNFKSPYANKSGVERHNEIVRDYFNKKTWEPSKYVQTAIDKYKSLATTAEQRMLQDAIEMSANLSKHIRELNFNDKNEKGDFINDTNKAIGYLKSLGPAVESLEKLRLKVEKGINEKNNNRANAELNIFDK